VAGKPPTDQEAIQAFWHTHIDGWRRGTLSQRLYCELHGLSRKSFCNWRARLKHEEAVVERKARWRRRPRTSPRTKPMTKVPAAMVSAGSRNGRRRDFAGDVKRRIVEETCQPGMSVSAVARRYGIAASVLFRWRRALGLGSASEPSTFVPVEIADRNDEPAAASNLQRQPLSPAPSIIVERPIAGFEIELIGGRRVRFDRDIDTETVRRMVLTLEGGGS
jgi:transposase